MRKIIIIGGVAGGATAATRLRRLDENLNILMFEKGGYVSFANCGLPYHISDTIPERKKLLLQSPESFKARYNVDVRIHSEVIKINRQAKTVQVKDLVSGNIYEESYDDLLLSPGAEPNLPLIDGIKNASHHYMRSVEDLDGVMAILKNTHTPQRALVLGGGFIGLEIAENLREANITTYVVEQAPQVMMPVDSELAAFIHKELLKEGVKLYLNTKVEKIETYNGVSKVYLSNHQVLEVDIILVATGVRPRTQLAKEAGLAIGKTGGLVVNEFFQTEDPHIFAVGDAIEIKHKIHGQPTLIPLAWLANRQGRLVADNILNHRPKPFKGGLGTAIVKIFNLTVASTGLNERFLKQNNIPYHVATVNRLDHAGYYPNAQDMIVKLLFTKEGKILGAQAIGPQSVDKRIDLIASAIQTDMSVCDLQEIEIAYAPPYNSAKDPVNILGYLAENILTGMVEQVEIHQVDSLLAHKNYALLDVRTPKEFEAGTIKGAENIELDTLRENLYRLDKSKTYIVFCRVGFRSYNACRILTNHGFKAVNLNGGYTLWETAMPRFIFNNYAAIDIQAHQFEVAISVGTVVSHKQIYKNNRMGCELLLRDLANLKCNCEDTLFYIRNNSSYTHVYQYLARHCANIWLHDNHHNSPFSDSSSVLDLLKYTIENATKAQIFEPNREIKQELSVLKHTKQRLLEIKNTLANSTHGEHSSDRKDITHANTEYEHRLYFDTLSALEQDLSSIDAKIETLWSLSVPV